MERGTCTCSRGAQPPVRSGGLGRRVLQWSMRSWILQNGHRGPRRHQEEPVKREEMQTGRRRFVACFVSGSGPDSLQCPFYLALYRIGDADKPGLPHTTAKLFGDQFEALGQWATTLSSKSEVELTPLVAQVGECRQMFSERFEKESCPYTSTVSQDIQGTHSHMDRFHLLVSPEPEGDFAHNSTVQWLSLSAMKAGMFRHRCKFVTGVARNATTPSVTTRKEEDASTLARNVTSR